MTYGVPNDLYDEAWNSTGTITFDGTNRMAVLSCAANGTCVLQSHTYGPYTPGRSQLALMSFVLGATPSYNTERRVGYYDGTNGVFLQQTPSAVNLVMATSTTYGAQTVPQASWNVDPMNGTGPSGLTLNLSNSQILVISFQALYAGRVTVGFDINGIIWPVHQFYHANVIAGPYIAYASLPVHYEVRSTGSNTASLDAICSSVVSEGGGALADIPGRTFGDANTAGAAVTTRRPILSIRSAQTYNGLPNLAIVLPNTVTVYTATASVYVELVRNGSLSGPSWSNIDPNSTAQVDTSATAINGGSTVYSTIVGSTFAGASSVLAIAENLLDRLVIAYSQLTSTPDTISVVATSLGASTTTYAALTWKEIRSIILPFLVPVALLASSIFT
jgi:hypothetical protein